VKRTWQLQEAKNKFSEVVDGAIQQGPQVITKRGAEVAVVISSKEYRKIVVCQKKLSDFFRESPLVGMDLELKRSTDPVRQEAAL